MHDRVLDQRLERFARQLVMLTEILRDEAQKFVRAPDETDLIAEAAGLPRSGYLNRNVGQALELAHGLDKIAAAILNEIDAASYRPGLGQSRPISPS